MAERRLDLITIGRAAVDLYGDQVGGLLEDMQSFSMYLGGCAANIAVGTSRLGLGSAMFARVGDEQMGRFVRQTLALEGVDVSHVRTDPERLTALVILGIRDRKSFPHIFYRTDCADMALEPGDIERGFIAEAGALLVTGTHFSQEKVDQASRTAIRYAKEVGTKVILDIDYRPVLWGLTGHAAGEERFIASDTVTSHLQGILADCDLVVGTEEEIAIAGGSTDTMTAVRAIRAVSPATIVVKRGPMGCVVFPDAIPQAIDDGIKGPGFPIEVFNTLGAGDGFMSGFLRGWLRNHPLEECCAFANACGALVVSRHGCCPASPSWVELQTFLKEGSPHHRLREDAKLNRLHRATTRIAPDWPEVLTLAFDHRVQLKAMAAEAGVSEEHLPHFKKIIWKGAQRAAEAASLPGPGILCDSRFGEDVLHEAAGSGWWISRPVEVPGSRPLAFEGPRNLAAWLRTWPREHVVKCLIFAHPDDDEAMREAQGEQMLRLYEACEATRHELMIEPIPPAGAPVDAETVADIMRWHYWIGVAPDWWKLQPPAEKAGWQAINEVLDNEDPHCRGVLLLGQDRPEAEIAQAFALAAHEPWCKGFAVGRTIFGDAARAWFAGKLSDDEAIGRIADNYGRLIGIWRQHRPVS